MSYFYSPWHETVIAFGLVLLALAAPLHFRARNTGTILYICWVFTANLFVLINRTIWHDHARNIAPIWCDISGKLLIGLHYSIGAASIIINRRLFKISRFPSSILTPAQKRKELTIELLIGLGIPGLGMCLHYIVQGHRGNIIQGIGCWPTYYITPLAFPLFIIWPCVLSVIAIYYGILCLRTFLKRRAMADEFPRASVSGLNADRYFRLMCFSAVELTIAFPLGLYQLLTDALNKHIFPWISWEDTHYNFDRYDQLPAIYFEQDPILSLQFGVLIWSIPFLAYIFFVFFGLGHEQMNLYKRWFFTLLKPFGINPPVPAPNPYNPYRSRNRRTWWQKLLRRPAHFSHGTGLIEPPHAFRRDPPNTANYPDKPIPSARGRVPHTASFSASLAFDFDNNLDIESNISGPSHHPGDPEGMLNVDVNKALPATSPIVDNPLSAHEDGLNEEKVVPRTRSGSMVSTSSASSVACSSRRVSAAIRDVNFSETEVHALEARV